MFVALLSLGAAASGGSTDMRSTQDRREDTEAQGIRNRDLYVLSLFWVRMHGRRT